jgi:hypothetical protein
MNRLRVILKYQNRILSGRGSVPLSRLKNLKGGKSKKFTGGGGTRCLVA